MKKKLFFLVTLFCCIGVALAKPVGPDQAKKAALTYIKKAVPAYAKLSAESLVDITSTTPFREFYVFSIDQKGFILVSGDNNVVPILGYSTSGNFPGENMPDNFRGWLQGYEREIAYIREHSVAESEELNSQWRQLLEDDAPDFEVIIEPLITTTWAQTAFYNNTCPLDANAPTGFNGHVPAGPVAVAVGQILRYYRWPEYLPGHYYTHSTYGTLSTSRNYQPYYYMPNHLTSSSSTDQVDAVSDLLYDIGVFLETNYGASGSSANLYVSDTSYPSAYKLLKNYCDYIWVRRIQKSSYSNSSWISNMRQQLWNEMPVLYRGSSTASGSHVFILDGYTSDDQFHINWGWGGQCDGYYTIGSLNPNDYDFNSDNSALVDITPPKHNITVSVNPQGAGQVVGTQNGEHPRGYQYEVAVEPAPGYRVLNMTRNGEDVEYYAHNFNTLTEDVHITYNLAPVEASDHYYYCTFNEGQTEDWVLVNGNQTNKWCIGNATSSEWYGTSLYISADNGVTQSYDTGARSYVWAYHEMTVPAGRYFVQYYWQCIGEHHPSYDYDYMRVFLVPANVTLTAGVIPSNVGTDYFSHWVPDGWISLNGTSPLNNYLAGGWNRFNDEVEVPVSGDYKLVVVWINDATQGRQPPAGIDRITFRPVTRTITVIPEYDLFDNTYYGGEVTNSGEYYAGNTCTLHATPWDRTVFRGWYDGDGQLLSSAPTYSFTVTDNDTVYARFEHNSRYYSSIFHPRDTSDWVFVNGNQTNKWCFGQAASLWDDGYSLYISNNGGVSNSYNTHNAGSIVYAYLKQPLPAGDFHFSCGWRANGENNYDYMRIFIAPVTDTLIAGVFPDGTSSCYNFRETIPDGWTQLGSTPNFNGDTLWYDYSCDMHIYNSWGYRLVFMWCNDNSVGSQPPAAVGRVRFEPKQYTVAASALPANAGTVLDTGTFTSGYYCTLTAVSAPGYRFAGWKNLTYNVIVSTDSVYSFNVWRNENLQAIFVPTNPMNYWCYFGTTGQDDTTGWVLVNDGQTNQWCIGNATATDNHRSLYISNDNGVSNAYDNRSTSISWAYREFDLTPGTYEVSYNWKADGESSYDWLRAFLVPDEYSLVAGQFNGNNYSSSDR